VILFWRFFARDEVVGIDVLQPDKHPAHARLRGFFDKVRDPVAQRLYFGSETRSTAPCTPGAQRCAISVVFAP